MKQYYTSGTYITKHDTCIGVDDEMIFMKSFFESIPKNLRKALELSLNGTMRLNPGILHKFQYEISEEGKISNGICILRKKYSKEEMEVYCQGKLIGFGTFQNGIITLKSTLNDKKLFFVPSVKKKDAVKNIEESTLYAIILNFLI